MNTTEEKRKLKVGDKVYETIYGDIRRILTIERLTNTQAIAGNMKFSIEYQSSGKVKEIGSSKDRWNTTHYYLETEELKERKQRTDILNSISRIDFEAYPTEKLLTVIGLLKA